MRAGPKFHLLKLGLAAFLRNRKGATAVEFALLALPMISLIMVSLQTVIIIFFQEALQTATNNVARQILVGNVQNLTQSQFKILVCNAIPSPFSCSGVMVDVQSAASFSSLNTTAIQLNYNANDGPTNTFNYSPGVAGSAVILRVMYDWPVVGGPLGIGLTNQGNGTFLMTGTSVFKNEPYS